MSVAEGRQVVHIETLQPREATYRDPSPPLPEGLQLALGQSGIERLYSHQVEALERVRNGENVIVVTSTSSGKTLCYNLPILERILQDRSARALYLYPINALINDQLKSLFRLNLALGNEAVGISRYTGALGSDERKAARARNPHIWLTNPEMLHLSYLLWHANWEDLWRNLRYIVIDEVHSYRGVFGSNMAHLFRRMLRVAEHYGSSPQFICCSATIANPHELAENLTGRPFSVIDRDGAGSARRYFVLWNPPLQGEAGENVRRSYAEESVDLLLHCMQARYNTIVFARARRLTERMLRMSRTVAGERGEENLLGAISSYRAGYLAEERESIEARLKAGEIRGIITTNALEMGIDIGGLDAAIISGYPGTIMSTWQQAGRAGRRGRDALVFLVASQNPLDQYYVQHPIEFFARPHELAVVDLGNQHIRLKHLLCAARELPLTQAELARMAADERALVEDLKARELLEPCALEEGEAEGLVYPKSRRDIHMRISLRAASQETFRIIDANRNEIGTIEPPNVYREAHPGAIYQHGGDDYRVVALDRQQHVVRVREEKAPHYTRATSALSLTINNVYASQRLGEGLAAFDVCLGDVLVEETIRGYQELQVGDDQMIKRVNLDNPQVIRLHTTAAWIALPPTVVDLLADLPPDLPEIGSVVEGDEPKAPQSVLEAGLHAVQHLLTGVMPLLVMCDRRDVDGYHHGHHAGVGGPVVFVYDAYEGGIGLAEVAYQKAGDWLRLAFETLSACRCTAGCPSCIQSGACRLRNEHLNKAAAHAVLAGLSGQSKTSETGLIVPVPRMAAAQSAPYGDQGAGRRAAAMRERAIGDMMEHTRRKGIFGRLAEAEPEEAVACQFSPGDSVDVAPFGRGRVVSSRMEGPRELVTVRFMHRNAEREVDASRTVVRRLP
ncbi:MAG: DEAD/DEAH box helicase [Anaerolineae bacterium]